MAADPIDPKIAAERLNERAKGTNVEARGTRFIEVSAERCVAELAFRPAWPSSPACSWRYVILSLADETATACSMVSVMPDGTWDLAKFR
jgi:hypothetical protein